MTFPVPGGGTFLRERILGLNWTLVDNGECILPRGVPLNDNGAVHSGDLNVSFYQALISQSVDWIITTSAGTVASGLTLATIGIYSIPYNAIHNIDENAECGLIGYLANDTSMWTAQYTPYSRQLTGKCQTVAGQYYGVGILAVGTTPPSLLSGGNGGFMAPYGGCNFTSQSSLPSSFTLGAANDPQQIYQSTLSPVNVE